MRLRASILGLAPLVLCTLGAAAPVSVVDAVKSGDLAAVRAAVQRESAATAADPDGTSALHWAARQGRPDIADILLRSGANPNATNRFGVTPLSLACESGDAALVGRLLDAGADVNAPLRSGETPLMTAARNGKPDVIKVLLARGAPVDAREPSRQQTALMWAAFENNRAAIELLLGHGADLQARSKGGFTALLFASREGQIEAARALLDAGANVDDLLPDGSSALLVAVTSAHYELAAVLVDYGADPNADAQGWTALHQIAVSRRPNTGINLPGPVPTGRMSGLDLARRLIERGADPDARVKKEIKDGYRNALNRIGATPFLLAARSVDLDLMQTLLDAGADPALTNVDNTTALMVAAGIGIWAPGESPGTADESRRAVEFLLDLGADVTAVDNNGETALHGAAFRGADPVVERLVQEGASLQARNKRGFTPWRMAEGIFANNTFKRNPETAALIRRMLEQRGLWPVE